MTESKWPVGADGPVAVFDSGVGGLSVLRHLRRLLPHEDLIYLADQAHVPYGPRPAPEVQHFARGITRFFGARAAKIVVVACNTATAAALNYLRATFPHVPFVGMEPAVKPGAARTETGKVGVLATAGTFESQRYRRLMSRYAGNVTLYEDSCRGLVSLIEEGLLDAPQTQALLERCMAPMLEAGVDTIVLGCTHYPFVLATIRAIAGPDVTIIDPAPAVARQTLRVLQGQALLNETGGVGQVTAFTTGDSGRFAALAQRLSPLPLPVSPLRWQGGRLVAGAN